MDGVDVVKQVHEELDRLSSFAEQVRAGEWSGATGRPIRAVVNIGIGGSDLGPATVYEALRAYATPDLTMRFVSNVDPADLTRAVGDLDPAETLFVVVSKTMTTLETIENAGAARAWVEAGSRHVRGRRATSSAWRRTSRQERRSGFRPSRRSSSGSGSAGGRRSARLSASRS